MTSFTIASQRFAPSGVEVRYNIFLPRLAEIRLPVSGSGARGRIRGFPRFAFRVRRGRRGIRTFLRTFASAVEVRLLARGQGSRVPTCAALVRTTRSWDFVRRGEGAPESAPPAQAAGPGTRRNARRDRPPPNRRMGRGHTSGRRSAGSVRSSLRRSPRRRLSSVLATHLVSYSLSSPRHATCCDCTERRLFASIHLTQCGFQKRRASFWSIYLTQGAHHLLSSTEIGLRHWRAGGRPCGFGFTTRRSSR